MNGLIPALEHALYVMEHAVDFLVKLPVTSANNNQSIYIYPIFIGVSSRYRRESLTVTQLTDTGHQNIQRSRLNNTRLMLCPVYMAGETGGVPGGTFPSGSH